MAEEKKMNKGLVAGIVAAVVAVIVAVTVVVVMNVTKTNIVGSYKLSAIIDSEGNESQDSLSMLKAFGMDYMIEFKDGGTGVLTVKVDSEALGSFMSAFTSDDSAESATSAIPEETKIDFTYDGKKIKLSTAVTGSTITEMDYEVKDGAAIVSMDSQKMKFTK